MIWQSWCTQYLGREVLKFGFGRDMPLQNLKADPYKYQFSRKSDPLIYQLAQFLAQFWAKSPDFSKIFVNLSQFWLKFGKILKINPYIYKILHFIRGYLYTKKLILLSMLAAHPCKVFLLSNHHPSPLPSPPPPNLGMMRTTSLAGHKT